MKRGLSNLRVANLVSGISAAYCCRLLADAGADVIKVEDHVGDPWRSWSIADAEIDHVEGGALFRFLHHGMRSVVGTPDEHDTRALFGTCDIVIEDGSLGEADLKQLCLESPGLVVLSITPYGRTGPYSGRPTSEFVVQAESGGLKGRGAPDGVPFQAGGRTSDWIAGTFAAVAVTAAALRAQQTGHGERIDFAISEAMNIAAAQYGTISQELAGNPPIEGVTRMIETPSIEPTTNGYVGFCTNSHQQFESFLILLERFDLLETNEYGLQAQRQARWGEWNNLVHAWTSELTTEQVVERASELRIPVAPVQNPDMVLANEHFAARNVFVDDPTGSFKMPRRPWRIDFEDPPPPKPSPRLGEHTGTVESRQSSRPAAPIGERRLPLEGVRVLDLTAWWAGPLSAAMLATLGADVIHFESISRTDGMRMTGGIAGLDGQWWERSPHFLASNVNKRGLTLDLTTDDGRAVARQLIATSDAVLDNYSPRVLENFGLGWDVIQEINPRCSLIRMPAFGLSGPWRDSTGFAQTMEQVTGMAWLTGHSDDQPRLQSGPSDPNAGMHAAFALIVALSERDETGCGSHVEATFVEAALNAVAEMAIERSAYGTQMKRDGNRSPNVAPQGLYACRGDENWLAISVETDSQWRALVDAIGADDWAQRGELASSSGRRASHDELDAGLQAWCAQRDVGEACELLVAHSVPAGVAWDPRAMMKHPQARHRGFFEESDHPVAGPVPAPGPPFRYASVDRWLRSPAPLLGQHNEDILIGDLGLDPDYIARLEAAGVIGQWPKGL